MDTPIDPIKALRPDYLYNTSSLAEALGIAESTVREKARTAKLPCVRHFGRFYFYGKDIIRSIRDQGEPIGDPSDWG